MNLFPTELSSILFKGQSLPEIEEKIYKTLLDHPSVAEAFENWREANTDKQNVFFNSIHDKAVVILKENKPNQSNEGFFDFGFKGQIVAQQINQKFPNILRGYTEDELPEKNDQELLKIRTMCYSELIQQALKDKDLEKIKTLIGEAGSFQNLNQSLTSALRSSFKNTDGFKEFFKDINGFKEFLKDAKPNVINTFFSVFRKDLQFQLFIYDTLKSEDEKFKHFFLKPDIFLGAMPWLTRQPPTECRVLLTLNNGEGFNNLSTQLEEIKNSIKKASSISEKNKFHIELILRVVDRIDSFPPNFEESLISLKGNISKISPKNRLIETIDTSLKTGELNLPTELLPRILIHLPDEKLKELRKESTIFHHLILSQVLQRLYTDGNLKRAIDCFDAQTIISSIQSDQMLALDYSEVALDSSGTDSTIFEQLPKCPNLKKLTLSHLSMLYVSLGYSTESRRAHLQNIFPKKLEELNLEECYIENNLIKTLAPNFKQLQKINLLNNLLTEECFIDLNTYLPKNLKEFRFSNLMHNINSAQLLESYTELKILSLNNCRTDVTTINSWNFLQNIEQLDLTECSLNELATIYLSNKLENSKNIRKLVLNNNPINQNEMQTLLEKIASTGIESLELNDIKPRLNFENSNLFPDTLIELELRGSMVNEATDFPSTLKKINLSGAFKRQNSQEFLNSLPNELEEIYLKNCTIDLKTNSFERFTDLKILDVSSDESGHKISFEEIKTFITDRLPPSVIFLNLKGNLKRTLKVTLNSMDSFEFEVKEFYQWLKKQKPYLNVELGVGEWHNPFSR